MAADIDAVIAALRVALEEAQGSDDTHWKVEASNRWINLLPGAWYGRWRNLTIGGDSTGDTLREEFIGHVRAVLAFLDASRTQIARPRPWWLLHRRSATTATSQPPRAATAPSRPVNLLRVRKPMPGVH